VKRICSHSKSHRFYSLLPAARLLVLCLIPRIVPEYAELSDRPLWPSANGKNPVEVETSLHRTVSRIVGLDIVRDVHSHVDCGVGHLVVGAEVAVPPGHAKLICTVFQRRRLNLGGWDERGGVLCGQTISTGPVMSAWTVRGQY
jgi:hypothetical protein